MGPPAGELLLILALTVLQASHGHHVTGGAGSIRVVSPLQAVQGSPEKGAWPIRGVIAHGGSPRRLKSAAWAWGCFAIA